MPWQGDTAGLDRCLLLQSFSQRSQQAGKQFRLPELGYFLLSHLAPPLLSWASVLPVRIRHHHNCCALRSRTLRNNWLDTVSLGVYIV